MNPGMLGHGGFYAHFKSKDALLAEALEDVFEESKRSFGRVIRGLPPRDALARYIHFYVSPAHRDDRSGQCPIVALNSDLPRQSENFRTVFDSCVRGLLIGLTDRIKAAGISDSEALAASVLAAMAGAVAVSRTVSDRRLSDELLKSALASIRARLGLSDVPLSEGMPE